MYDPNLGGKETPGLEDYLRAVRTRKWLVALAAALGLALAFLYAQSRTDTYEASARVRVAPTPVGSLNNNLKAPILEEESAIFESFATADAVISELDLDVEPTRLLSDLSIRFQPDSRVLEATYATTDPQDARDRVAAFAEAYTASRTDAATAYYDTLIASIEAEAQPLRDQLAQVEADLALNAEAITTARATLTGAELNATFSELNSARNALTAERGRINNLLNQRNNQIGTVNQQQATLEAPARVLGIDPVPESPTGLSNGLLYGAGLVLGTILGVLGAFVLDRLDTTARGSADIELASGASVLGSVPQFGLNYRSGSAALVMLNSGKSTSLQRSREAYRRLRTSVQYLSTTRDVNTLLITSAQPGEGKSVTSANLAIALAQGGTSVALVSADMRRPTIENLFGIRNNDGLSVALRSPESTSLPVVSVGVENLVVVPSGPTPERPGELLGSERFRSLIDQLESTYDVVIVDTPPILAAADAGSAASAVEGVVLLIDPAKTDTEVLLQVRSELNRIGADVVGSILNREKSRSGRFFGRYDYSYEKAAART